ncbi:MAG TPA: putative metal-dependent hydrolase [Flavobacteriaceae bacterium]|nr:putative metal-dependent hydrolase [Flavobacteriaceae bacterium]HPF10604.1 putative metal-dependent hydrolase [Flavobacteriaceae bacterium]HQU20886.1 putative metal-dependent hydrolase [Flavobacteriaceae bacterium]HQU64370.1 putative metal-dependent hydrolase [Flavobacteriaceae bacterium]HRW43281.1 putative metal-dependent hydrolase [Flavobacteriaceae bacterium]
MELDQLKYPIGKFKKPQEITKDQREEAIDILALFPEQLKQLTYNLKDAVIDQPYRPGGWTIRQLVHHISDSHTHCYNRVRWTLTEDNPLIKAYDQDAFAQMYDYQKAPIAWSISHLEAIHQKMVYIFRNLSEDEWNRTFRHPETGEEIALKSMVMLYAWHSMHHFAHIKNALKK